MRSTCWLSRACAGYSAFPARHSNCRGRAHAGHMDGARRARAALDEQRSCTRIARNGALVPFDRSARRGRRLAILRPWRRVTVRTLIAREPIAVRELEAVVRDRRRRRRANFCSRSCAAVPTMADPSPGSRRNVRNDGGGRVSRDRAGGARTIGDVALTIVHRVGELAVGEIAVAVVAAAPHRGPAFEACGYAIDEVKRRAPIWKKEHYAGGARSGAPTESE